jgi:hypothetical protein
VPQAAGITGETSADTTARIAVLDADAKQRSVLLSADVLRLPGALLPIDFPPSLIRLVNRLRQHGTFGDAASVHCGIAVPGFGRAIGSGPESIIQSGDVQRFRLRTPQAFDAGAAGIDSQRLDRQRVAKIVVPGMFQELCAARSAPSQLLGRVYYIPIEGSGQQEARRRAALLLALLNSRLYRVLYRGLFDAVAQAGGWLRLNGPYLAALPWPAVEPPDNLIAAVESAEQGTSWSCGDRLDDLVDRLFELTEAERVALKQLAGRHGSKMQRSGPEASRQVAHRRSRGLAHAPRCRRGRAHRRRSGFRHRRAPEGLGPQAGSRLPRYRNARRQRHRIAA